MRLCTLLALLALAGCTPKAKVPAANIRPAEAYLDLEPNWRLRSVSSLRKPGSSDSEPAVVAQSGLNLTVQASSSLLGYQTDYFSIEKSGGNVHIRFASAERVIEGKGTPVDKPVSTLASLPDGMKHLRMLYLLEASEVNHSMALLAAKTLPQMEELMREVQRNPSSACQSSKRRHCEWMPPKVAVRAEKRDARSQWVPVR